MKEWWGGEEGGGGDENTMKERCTSFLFSS